MTVSEEIRAIRDKYDPKNKVLKQSQFCKNPYAYSIGECQRCGVCGRQFDENQKLIRKAPDEEDE